MNKLLTSIRIRILSTIARLGAHLFIRLFSLPTPAPIHARRAPAQRTRVIEGEFRRLDEPNRW